MNDRRVPSNEVILERVETVISRQKETNDKLDRMNGCLRTVEIEQGRQHVRIDNNKGDIEKVEKRVNAWGGVNSLGAFIAGVLGLIGIRQ